MKGRRPIYLRDREDWEEYLNEIGHSSKHIIRVETKNAVAVKESRKRLVNLILSIAVLVVFGVSTAIIMYNLNADKSLPSQP